MFDLFLKLFLQQAYNFRIISYLLSLILYEILIKIISLNGCTE